MKNYILLSFLKTNDLRKIVNNENKTVEYKKYLFDNQLEDSRDVIIKFISNNVQLNFYHKMVQDLKMDETVYGDDWLDSVNDKSYCQIV